MDNALILLGAILVLGCTDNGPSDTPGASSPHDAQESMCEKSCSRSCSSLSHDECIYECEQDTVLSDAEGCGRLWRDYQACLEGTDDCDANAPACREASQDYWECLNSGTGAEQPVDHQAQPYELDGARCDRYCTRREACFGAPISDSAWAGCLKTCETLLSTYEQGYGLGCDPQVEALIGCVVDDPVCDTCESKQTEANECYSGMQ